MSIETLKEVCNVFNTALDYDVVEKEFHKKKYTIEINRGYELSNLEYFLLTMRTHYEFMLEIMTQEEPLTGKQILLDAKIRRKWYIFEKKIE